MTQNPTIYRRRRRRHRPVFPTSMSISSSLTICAAHSLSMLVETAGVDSPLFPFLLFVLWCTMKSSTWVAGNTWRESTQPSTNRTRGKQQSEQCGILARGVNS